MKTVLTASLIGASLLIAAPAVAQSLYAGPGGVGLNTGVGPRQDYDRGRDRDIYRENRVYEGRSAYDRDGDFPYRNRY